MFNDIRNELSVNFIEYAAAVNTDRALPDAKSGLKPVAKRILWSAYEQGRLSSKPHVKSARIVGDCMAAYHPHGDSSIYGAMVRLSQNWVMRYPLIDWHGNNGNIAGDGPAAGRYTEARLSKISEDGLLTGLKKRNVDFCPNYDETLEEPVTLPSIFPNLLCNPNTGIGVAMACNWLPHNLKEVADAINMYLDGGTPTLPGPDFPTGGIIVNKNDIPSIMKSGHGSVKVRGRYKVEKQNIIFYEIPFTTTIEGLIDEIGEVCKNKEIEGIKSIEDNSNKNGIRIVISCDKGVDPESIVKKLFLKTDLQLSISYNQVALIDKTPTEMNLQDCIEVYVDHNIDCIVREAKYDLKVAEDRLHIVDGLLKALEDIDNIIALIKKSANATVAKENLIAKYGFSEVQAKAILAMRLSSLANLEKVELQNEKAELQNTISHLMELISSDIMQKAELRTRLAALVKKYGDDRRTELMQLELPKEDKEIEAVVPEDVVVIMTQSGYIKRVPKASFKTQKRNGKGVKNEDDALLDVISTNTVDTLMLFSNKGKMYRLVVDNIPVGTNTTKGAAIAGIINLEPNEKIIAINSLYRKTTAEYVVFFTKKGLIKKTSLEEYSKVKRSTGIVAITLKDDDTLANVTFLKDEDVIIITKQGMSIHFETKDINAIGRATSGVKAIKLNENDEVLIGLPIHNINDNLAIITTKGTGKKVALEEFPLQARYGKGVCASLDEVCGAAMISNEDNLLLLGRPNSICISANDVPKLGRTAQGNIMIKDSKLISMVKL